MFLRSLIFLFLLSYQATWHQATAACLNRCGDIPISYPFGTDEGCGSSVFQKYIKCNDDILWLVTETGQYQVHSIDTVRRIIIVSDNHMSTCKYMQRTSSSFGLQAGTPFSLQGAKILLFGCSSSTATFRSQCDPAGASICKTLYGCPTIATLGLSANSPTSSCCLYNVPNSGTPPFTISPSSLGCPSYTSVYSFGGSTAFTTNYKDANTWSYGIPLFYTYDETVYTGGGCKACEDSHGSCAFNSAGTLTCICTGKVNTTSICPQQANYGVTTTTFMPNQLHLIIGATSLALIRPTFSIV